MQTIYKYEVPAGQRFILDLPKNAKILSLQPQHGAPCMWALVDTEAPKEKRVFETYGTGHPIKPTSEIEQREFINTFQIYGGDPVFHLFEIILPF